LFRAISESRSPGVIGSILRCLRGATEAKTRKGANYYPRSDTMLALCPPTHRCLSVKAMIEIDCGEFHGDRHALADYLREKLKVEVQTDRKVLRIGPSGKPDAGPSTQEVKDLVKRALHHIGAEEYHVVTQEGVLSIRQRKTREHYAKRKGSAPSVQQTVPYFFPG
jgi:hypothetical protein